MNLRGDVKRLEFIQDSFSFNSKYLPIVKRLLRRNGIFVDLLSKSRFIKERKLKYSDPALAFDIGLNIARSDMHCSNEGNFEGNNGSENDVRRGKLCFSLEHCPVQPVVLYRVDFLNVSGIYTGKFKGLKQSTNPSKRTHAIYHQSSNYTSTVSEYSSRNNNAQWQSQIVHIVEGNELGRLAEAQLHFAGLLAELMGIESSSRLNDSQSFPVKIINKKIEANTKTLTDLEQLKQLVFSLFHHYLSFRYNWDNPLETQSDLYNYLLTDTECNHQDFIDVEDK